MDFLPPTVAPEPPPPSDEHAPSQLSMLDPEGGPVTIPFLTKSLASAARILRDSRLRERLLGPGELELNEMTGTVELDRRPVDDAVVHRFREAAELQVRGRDVGGKAKVVTFGRDVAFDAFTIVAAEHRYHPVADYLRALPELGPGDSKAIEAACKHCLGVTDALSVRLVRMWAISAVARALDPGCKVDTVLILVGPQGHQKSSFFAALGGEWFADSAMDLDRPDSRMQLRQSWIYEWPELAAFKRKDWETIKAFVSSRQDTYRAPFSRSMETVKRSGVIVGTTNRTDIFGDATGNRRFWPVAISKPIDAAFAKTIRGLFWRAARDAYEAGERWWLDDESALLDRHREFETIDPWQEEVTRWLGKADGPVTTRRVLKEALRLTDHQMDRATEMRCSDLMRQLGWQPAGRQRVDGTVLRPWRPTSRDGSDQARDGSDQALADISDPSAHRVKTQLDH